MYLKLRIEGVEKRLSCAIKAIANLKGFRCQRTKHLREQTKKEQGVSKLVHSSGILVNLQFTCPSLSLMTRRTGVSWPCMALYSVLMLMPCFDVPKASAQGYPMVRGGRCLASWGKRKKKKKGVDKELEESRKKKEKRNWNSERPQPPMLNYMCGDIWTQSGV